MSSGSAAIWLENYVTRALNAYATNEHASAPARNLLSPLRSATWQSNGLSDVSVYFDFGQIVIPQCVGIADPNFSRGSAIAFVGSDDLVAATNVVSWVLPLYPVDPAGGVLAWYLGDPTSGTLGSGRQFWRINILPSLFGQYNPTDADGLPVNYYEIGAVWIGTYLPVHVTGVDHDGRNPSSRAYAYGGAPWSDPLRSYEQLSIDLDYLNFSSYYALKSKLKSQGEKYVILDLHANATDPVVRAGCVLYGKLSDRPFRGRLESPDGNRISLEFEETRG